MKVMPAAQARQPLAWQVRFEANDTRRSWFVEIVVQAAVRVLSSLPCRVFPSDFSSRRRSGISICGAIGCCGRGRGGPETLMRAQLAALQARDEESEQLQSRQGQVSEERYRKKSLSHNIPTAVTATAAIKKVGRASCIATHSLLSPGRLQRAMKQSVRVTKLSQQ
jgi:hypothetical protein